MLNLDQKTLLGKYVREMETAENLLFPSPPSKFMFIIWFFMRLSIDTIASCTKSEKFARKISCLLIFVGKRRGTREIRSHSSSLYFYRPSASSFVFWPVTWRNSYYALSWVTFDLKIRQSRLCTLKTVQNCNHLIFWLAVESVQLGLALGMERKGYKCPG